MYVSSVAPSALPPSFEEQLVPELVSAYGTKRPATVRMITPNHVPKHSPGRWESPHPGLVFDIRLGKILPRASDLQAAPTDIAFFYMASRDRLDTCRDLARAIKATPGAATRQILVACSCNRWHARELEAEFGPMIWTPDCGGNYAMDQIIEVLINNWPIG